MYPRIKGPEHIFTRPFRAADQTAVHALILAGLTERWGTPDPTLNQELNDIAAAFATGSFLVAITGSEIIGCGGLLPLNAGKGQIVRMSTAEAWRRQGAGRLILQRLESIAAASGFTQVVLETTHTWYSAVRFYQRQGYQISHHEDEDIYFFKYLKVNLNSQE